MPPGSAPSTRRTRRSSSRRCCGNRYLPQVDLEAALAGGGSLTVLEFLASAPDAAATELVRQWTNDQGDSELAAVKTAERAIEKEYRTRVSWWDGVDINPGNIRLSADGRLVLIDIFCMDGAALYGQVLMDAAVVRRRLPETVGHQLLEIPYLARESSPTDLQARCRVPGQSQEAQVHRRPANSAGPATPNRAKPRPSTAPTRGKSG